MKTMNAPEFYAILDEYRYILKEAGFARKNRNSFMKDDVKLQFILNKWGWTENEGWGFLIRLYDMKDVKEFEMPPNTDITPNQLIEEGYVDGQSLRQLYGSVRPEVFVSVQQNWYGFYDEKHLKEVLLFFLPSIAEATLKWIEKRKEDRKKPKPAYVKPSPEEIERIREETQRWVDSIKW